MDIKKMKMSYLKWCMENDKNPSEETMQEFFKTLGENSKVSFDGIIKNLDMKIDSKVDAIIGFVLDNDEDDDSTSIKMFAAGHSNKGALVKATLNQINALFFDGQFELNFNVGNDDANKIISMLEALLLVLTKHREQESDEIETDEDQKYMN